jgi:hypothetical protein
MAYAILVASEMPPDGVVAWPFRIQLADKTASVLNPSVDLLQASFWYVAVKVQVKASNNVVDFVLQSADVLAGTGNVNKIAGFDVAVTPSAATPHLFASAGLGTTILAGWFPRSQEFLNIIATLGGTCTYDAEVWATPMK